MARGGSGGLLARSAAALVLAPLALALAWAGGPWLAAALAACAWIMLFEWFRMTGVGGAARHLPQIAAALAGVPVFAFAGSAPACLAALAAAAAVGAVLARRARSLPWGLAGPVLVGVPLALAWHLREVPSDGRALLLWCLLVVWATDTAAYAGGRLFGGPRLAPRISPAKTWSGLAAGLAAATLAGAGAAALLGLDPAMGAPGGFAAGGAAVAGDLAVSAAKRAHGTKDAGALIPGHGGLLDRLDGFLGASALLAGWALLAGQGT